MGVPELPQPTLSKSLGLAGEYEEELAVETRHEGLKAQGQMEASWRVRRGGGHGPHEGRVLLAPLHPRGWISRPTRAPLQAHRAQLLGTAAGGSKTGEFQILTDFGSSCLFTSGRFGPGRRKGQLPLLTPQSQHCP